MRIKDLPKVLHELLKADITPMVVGHHGIGKSSSLRQYSKANDMELVVVRLGNMTDAGDLLGLGDFVVDKDGNKIATKFFAPDWWPRDPDSKGIIFLDEVNRIRNSSILQAVFGLCEPRFIGGRKLHTHVLPDGWRVVAASNPPTDDYDVIDITDAAFVDRFCYLKIDSNPSDHHDYMRKTEMSPELIAFCVEHEKTMYPTMKEFSLDFVKPSNRSIEQLDIVLKQKPEKEILNHISFGLIGTEATVIFNKFLEENEKLVEPKDIIENYKKIEAKVKSIAEKGRLDMMGNINDNLLLYLQKNDVDKAGWKNIGEYLKLVPKDLYWSFLVSVMESENTEFLKMLADVVPANYFSKHKIEEKK